ncbi:MAG: pyruvate dehydrogenase (acetyl-transferring) E1 component subunit alpha [bacterium]
MSGPDVSETAAGHIIEDRLEDLEIDPDQKESFVDELGDDTLLEMYRRMVLIREFEETTYQIYLQRKIGGFCHIYSGEEAVAIGAFENIDTDQDYSITAYRDHGHALAAGMSPKSVMAELYGKATGCSRGKGGSMHLFDTDLNFMGGHAIVGGHLPLAAGLGFKVNYREEDNVVLCFFGDGAMNQGALHEAMNLIGLYNLPVVLICENNGYGMGTAVDRASAESDLYRRSASYDIDGYRVNGLDVMAVYELVGDAVERARQENKPTFIEAVTYRFRGHSMSDPAEYRSREELENFKKKDPIKHMASILTDEGIIDDSDVDAIQDEMQETVQEAVEFAEDSPEPENEEVYEDIYNEYPRDLTNPQ